MVLDGLIWGIANVAMILTSIKWYLPKIIKDSEEEIPNTTKKEIVVIALFSLGVTFACGFFSGLRGDEFLSVLRMLIGLIILNVTAITDYKTMKIPNLCILIMLGGRFFVFVLEFSMYGSQAFSSMVGSLLVGVIGLVFFLLMSKITRGGIGYGDVKEFSAIGFLCGFRALIYTVLFSFLVTSIVSAVLLLSKKKSIRDAVPMGPFIWLGFAITIILGVL